MGRSTASGSCELSSELLVAQKQARRALHPAVSLSRTKGRCSRCASPSSARSRAWRPPPHRSPAVGERSGDGLRGWRENLRRAARGAEARFAARAQRARAGGELRSAVELPFSAPLSRAGVGTEKRQCSSCGRYDKRRGGGRCRREEGVLEDGRGVERRAEVGLAVGAAREAAGANVDLRAGEERQRGHSRAPLAVRG